MNVHTLELWIVAVTTLGGVVITACASILTVVLQRKSKQTTDKINKAVNNVPDSDPTLYSLVWENHERANRIEKWMEEYTSDENGPLNTGAKAREFVSYVHDRFGQMDRRLRHIEAMIESLRPKH